MYMYDSHRSKYYMVRCYYLCVHFIVLATAIVSRNYVITYDNQIVPITTNCELILTRDVHSSFTMTFEPSVGKVKLVAPGNDIDVIDDGDTGMIVQDRVSYHYIAAHDVYVITLSGWMKGRVIGLLGTFTGEQYDDFIMPNGVAATTAAVG